MRRIAIIGLALTLIVVAAGCGQKPGVAQGPLPTQPVSLDLPEGAHVDPQTGHIVDAQGNVIGDASSLGISQGGVRASEAQDAAEAEDSTAPLETSSNGPPSGGNATGVTDDVIRIGAHAPLTGAAPVPSDSAQKGNDLFYRWLQEMEKPINGRHVEAILKDDNYNPSQAIAVCKEMVEKDRVFLLYGFAGTDQIQACARYAASVAVPYVSVGVTESGLRGLPGYFAISRTYSEQAPLLADLLASDLGAKGEKNGMLWFQTPNFQDAHDSFFSAMKRVGAKVSYDRPVSKHAGQSEAQTVVNEMRSRGIENVYVLTSPVWFLQVLQAARAQGYAPQWVGVGITKALDTVASVGCRNGTLNGAKFFSPFPAWAEINDFDPDFQKAVQAVHPEEDRGDDIMLIGWGFGKVMARLLELPGKNLTRERFVYFAERGRELRTGVYPSVSFSPNDHFGGSQVHLNEAQCSGYRAGDNRWHTIKSFVSDF